MNRRILIVEDDLVNAKLFRHVLQHYGYYNLIETENGEAVYRLVQEHQPELIIMDIKLPGISGVEVTRILKSDPHLEHIPIIAVSALSYENEVKEIKASGCNAYLAKPFHIDEFISCIQRFLRSDRSPANQSTTLSTLQTSCCISHFLEDT